VEDELDVRPAASEEVNDVGELGGKRWKTRTHKSRRKET
jgi:hypothetical protein